MRPDLHQSCEATKHGILKTYRVRGTELSFLLLVRSAGVTDGQTDRQTDRHNKGALGLLVINTLKLSSGFSYSVEAHFVSSTVGVRTYNI